MNTLLLMVHWFEHYSVVIMTLIFVGIVAYYYWPSRKDELEQQGRIPLEDDV
jgi:cbb3-type cytochrome oxidase subunit 3